jgi:hypothetical protein
MVVTPAVIEKSSLLLPGKMFFSGTKVGAIAVGKLYPVTSKPTQYCK